MQPIKTLGKGVPEPTATKACPICGQWGHWKMDCPQGCPGTPGEVPTSQTWRVECPQGCPGAPGKIPTSPQNPSPTLRELFQWWHPGSSPPARVLDTSSELRGRLGSGQEKDLFYSRHRRCFLSVNFLLWPNSRVRTHNQGGSLEFP